MTARCLRGPHCADPHTTPTGKAGAPTSRPLCDACTDQTRQALEETPTLYYQLRKAARTPRLSQALTERVTTSATHPMLIDGAAIDLTDHAHWLLTHWADKVLRTASRPRPNRRHQPEDGQLYDACHILGRYLTAWTVHGPALIPTDGGHRMTQSGWEACHALITWRAHARRHLKLEELIHRPPEPCPNCNTPRALERRDGADKVTCRICHKSWTLAMYETFVHAWLGTR